MSCTRHREIHKAKSSFQIHAYPAGRLSCSSRSPMSTMSCVLDRGVVVWGPPSSGNSFWLSSHQSRGTGLTRRADDLRGHVLGRADENIVLRNPWIILPRFLHESEIEHLDHVVQSAALTEHDVRRLDVPMDQFFENEIDGELVDEPLVEVDHRRRIGRGPPPSSTDARSAKPVRAPSQHPAGPACFPSPPYPEQPQA